MTDTAFFYAFAALTLIGAILTVTLRNAVHCALSLIASLAGVAGLYLLQRAEFLFAVQIVVANQAVDRVIAIIAREEVVILAAGIWGYLCTQAATTIAPAPPAALARSLRAAAVWLTIWLVPLGLLILAAPQRLADIGVFFSKLAVLTFGGAYAVLAWMAQDVVELKGWLTLPQMMDGLGLAETTPGPLILVNEFVGYMAAYQVGGWAYGLAGAAIAVWMTFIPSFLFIFTGAPFIDRLTHMPRLSGALAAITAAVVGVIANLSLWFALHVLFSSVSSLSWGPMMLALPELATIRIPSAAIAILAAAALLRWHWPLPLVLALAACGSALAALG